MVVRSFEQVRSGWKDFFLADALSRAAEATVTWSCVMHLFHFEVRNVLKITTSLTSHFLRSTFFRLYGTLPKALVGSFDHLADLLDDSKNGVILLTFQ